MDRVENRAGEQGTQDGALSSFIFLFSGAIHIIYLHYGGVRLYINHSGNGWSEPQILNIFPHLDDLLSIAHSLNLKTDDYGNALQSVAVVYPRRQADEDTSLPDGTDRLISQVQQETHFVYTENHFTHEVVVDIDNYCHSNAADTRDGITTCWFLWQRFDESTVFVQKVLDYLIAESLVKRKISFEVIMCILALSDAVAMKKTEEELWLRH